MLLVAKRSNGSSSSSWNEAVNINQFD